MLLEHILGQLDGELARWQQLRAIIASLATPAFPAAPSPKAGPAPTSAPATISTPAATQILEHSTAAQALAHRRPRVFKSQRRLSIPLTLEPRALTAAIPAGPVVVFAATLKERETERQRMSLVPASPPLDPEVLLRELSQRWGTGASAS